MAINQHFQMMTQEDLDNLKHGNTPMVGDAPLKFIGIKGLREIRNLPIGAIEALTQALKAREVKAEAIRNDPMTSALAKNAAMEALDAKHVDAIAGHMASVTNFAAEAMTQEPFWSRPAALFRCKFDQADAAKDAQIRGDLARRLERMLVNGLVDVARLALATQNGDDRLTAAAMTACLAEEIQSRGSSLTPGDHKALGAFMDQINCFDVEARKIVAEMAVSAKECLLLGNDRRGLSTQVIATGLQRAAVDKMPNA